MVVEAVQFSSVYVPDLYECIPSFLERFCNLTPLPPLDYKPTYPRILFNLFKTDMALLILICIYIQKRKKGVHGFDVILEI